MATSNGDEKWWGKMETKKAARDVAERWRLKMATKTGVENDEKTSQREVEKEITTRNGEKMVTRYDYGDGDEKW